MLARTPQEIADARTVCEERRQFGEVTVFGPVSLLRVSSRLRIRTPPVDGRLAAPAVMSPTEAPKRLVIVGATGMVGGYALRCALDHPAVGIATAIGRKPTGLSHPKLNEVLTDRTQTSVQTGTYAPRRRFRNR